MQETRNTLARASALGALCLWGPLVVYILLSDERAYYFKHLPGLPSWIWSFKLFGEHGSDTPWVVVMSLITWVILAAFIRWRRIPGALVGLLVGLVATAYLHALSQM